MTPALAKRIRVSPHCQILAFRSEFLKTFDTICRDSPPCAVPRSNTTRMAIQKQEFYEGAALHQLIRGAGDVRVRFSTPLFVLDERLQIHLKYSTATRSPWGFTFNSDEQKLLLKRSAEMPLVIGLVCGSDGIAVLSFEQYSGIARPRSAGVHVACFRKYREHFEITGPDGSVPGKVPPSDWHRLLNS